MQVDDKVIAEMTAKHPRARDTEGARLGDLRSVAAASAIQVDGEAVQKALSSFSRGSGAGPSGLRPQHLKDAMVPGLRDELSRHMVEVVNLMARGQPPPQVQHWLCGASLAALPKASGDLRPVAVGETWRRLAGKALAHEVAPELRNYLEPVQLGVGTPGGCEAVVHVVRQWMARNSGDGRRVLVTLDLANAFNSVDRSAFLTEVRRVVPGIAPWVDFCYQHESQLLLGAAQLASSRGIQQGDPLGPALFALAIHESILRARAAAEAQFPGGLDFTAFFLDDGTVAGDADAVAKFVEVFSQEMADKAHALATEM